MPPLDELRAQTAVMVMYKGIVVEGIVRAPQGRPIAGATVGQSREQLRSNFPRAKTDENGHYRFPPCEPGEFTLSAAAPGYAPDARRVTVTQDRRTVDLQLRRGETIRLRVVDKEGKPVAGAQVQVGYRKPEEFLLRVPNRTDTEGRWSWVWTPEEKLPIYVSMKGYAQVAKELAPADQEQVITLAAELWTASGRVVDRETNAPITKFRVLQGRPASNLELDYNWQKAELFESADGQYHIQWEMYGDLRRVLRIEADGYLPSEGRPLRADERHVTFNVELTKGRVISGTVRSPDGKPLGNAEVVLCTVSRSLDLQNGRQFNRESSLAFRTGSDGGFSFAPQRDPYILVVLHDQGYAEVDGQTGANEITVRSWSRVEGMLRVGGRPAVNQPVDLQFSVVASRPGRPTPVERVLDRLHFQYLTYTDTEGRFVFDRVRPGKATVYRLVKEGSAPYLSPVDGVAVEIAPGQTVKVDLRGSDGP
jgi:hypothetical protein